MYALLEIGGRQYKAVEGSLLKVDRLQHEEGDAVEFSSVVMLRTDDDVTIGRPYVDGARVKTVVESHGVDRKVTASTYRKRKDYKRNVGIRPRFSLIRVKELVS